MHLQDHPPADTGTMGEDLGHKLGMSLDALIKADKRPKAGNGANTKVSRDKLATRKPGKQPLANTKVCSHLPNLLALNTSAGLDLAVSTYHVGWATFFVAF